MSFVKTILCPVDFSDGSNLAVEQAATVAKATGAHVELLHVYTLPVLSLPEGPILPSPEYVGRIIDGAQKALNELSEGLVSQGVSASTQLLEGAPGPSILARAKELDASMLVLGTHGRKGFKRFMLGSTTERVVRLSSIPVLAVQMTEEGRADA